MTRRPRTAPAPAATQRLTNDPLDWLAGPPDAAAAPEAPAVPEPAAAPASASGEPTRNRRSARSTTPAKRTDTMPAAQDAKAASPDTTDHAPVQRLLADMKKMATAHVQGDIDHFMDPSAYPQELAAVAGLVNEMVQSHIGTIGEALTCFRRLGEGDLDAPVSRFPGAKSGANDAIEAVRSNLRHAASAAAESDAQINRLMAEVRSMSAAHVAGDEDVRMDAAAYPGELRHVAEALNEMADAQVQSIEEAIRCFEAIGEGNFDAPIRQWPGKRAMVNRVIDRFRTNMKAVTAEVAMLSDSIVEGRLDREVDLSKFSGDFVEIVRSFERTYASLNGVFHSLSVQLEQTAQTVMQVSQASQSLATNSAVQSSSVDEVSASAEETDSQVKANAAAARSASLLVEGAATVAAEGREKVTEMVQAMEGIRVSSQGIAKIIKVIDEIAFQTNLLALNAAVEAARAGQHGRGFAVVAHEVRNLAGRSAKAARETSELIEDAGSRVQAGVRIATETSRSFVSIVDDIEKVKALVQDISRASDEQTRNVAQISSAIGEVAKSALSTSQQADELASSATQMQAATEAMRTEIGRFKLRKVRELVQALPSLEALPPEMLAQLQQMVAAQMGLASARPITASAPPAARTNGHGTHLTDRDERGFADF
ncbi:methyl-accepting chemotaxis protein [Cereibacter azotoformans]|uniref:methyl-accepting chemotaxis protein n=1 Tax=Cereibacter azotoformans TaxID=43057 RepID=UPI000C6E7262|nr:methyl-accepting chemotaxis protein [Cereibacter azotoformans]